MCIELLCIEIYCCSKKCWPIRYLVSWNSNSYCSGLVVTLVLRYYTYFLADSSATVSDGSCVDTLQVSVGGLFWLLNLWDPGRRSAPPELLCTMAWRTPWRETIRGLWCAVNITDKVRIEWGIVLKVDDVNEQLKKWVFWKYLDQ